MHLYPTGHSPDHDWISYWCLGGSGGLNIGTILGVSLSIYMCVYMYMYMYIWGFYRDYCRVQLSHLQRSLAKVT